MVQRDRTLQRNVAVLGWCLAAWIALPGTTLVGAQPPAVEPPPSVAVIDQRLLETAQDPSLDDAAKATVRGLYQQALSELEAAARWRVTALDFVRRTRDAPAALSELEAAVAAPPPDASPAADSPGQRWLQRSMTDGEVATLEQELAEVRTQLGGGSDATRGGGRRAAQTHVSSRPARRAPSRSSTWA